MRPLSTAAARFGLMDYPDGARRINTRAVPRIGGIAIIIGTVAGLLAIGTLGPLALWYLLAVAVLLVFGVLDDRNGLRAGPKFVGQLIAASIIVFGADVVITHAPLCGFDALPSFVGVPLTILTLVAITNAVNLSDGLDGLAGGSMFLALVVIGLLAYDAQDGGMLLVLCCIVAGATLGFLRYNTYPAWVFMGDTGSQFLGFSAGVFTILLTQQVNPALSPALPFLILGLPVFDTMLVMFYRWRNNKPLFVADNNHIHHRLLSLGLQHYEAVLIIYCAQALLIVAAFALRYEFDWVVLCAYGVFVVGSLLLLRFVTKNQWKSDRFGVLASAGAALRRVRERRLHIRWPRYVMTSCVVLTFLVGAICFEAGPQEAAIAALLGITLLVVGLSWAEPGSGLERGCLFGAAAFFAFQITGFYQSPSVDRVLDLLMLATVASLILSIRYSNTSAVFRVSPLDFLVLFVVIAVTALGKLQVLEPALGNTLAFIIIPAYAIEVGTGEKRGASVIRWGTIAALALVAAKGFGWYPASL